MSFLDLSSLGLPSTSSDLLADWLATMQTFYPGYVPSDANLEYVDAQSIAAVMSDVAQTGVVVPDAIARAFGTKLYNIAYLQGVAATASVQVTAVDGVGYTLPAGTNVTLGSYGFITAADLVIPALSTTGTVTVTAAVPGTAYNGATNPTQVETAVNWIASVTALAPASGGVDPEDDTAYQNRLAGFLRLLAPRPITAGDYSTMALSFAPAVGTDQQEIGRATALDGYLQGSASFTVTTVNTNATLTVTTPPGTGIAAAPGATITGTGIPANTIVNSATTSTIVMSQAATASASGIVATVGGTLNNQRTVTVGVTDANGTQWGGGSPATDTIAALQAWLRSLREVNFVVNVIAPTYTPVYVTVSVHLYPGFDPVAAQTAIQAAVMNFLSPATFGLPAFGDTAQWLSGTTIYASQLLSVIQNAGNGAVQYVVDNSLKFGTSASPTNVLDLVIPGPIALPSSTTTTVPVPTIV